MSKVKYYILFLLLVAIITYLGFTNVKYRSVIENFQSEQKVLNSFYQSILEDYKLRELTLGKEIFLEALREAKNKSLDNIYVVIPSEYNILKINTLFNFIKRLQTQNSSNIPDLKIMYLNPSLGRYTELKKIIKSYGNYSLLTDSNQSFYNQVNYNGFKPYVIVTNENSLCVYSFNIGIDSTFDEVNLAYIRNYLLRKG